MLKKFSNWIGSDGQKPAESVEDPSAQDDGKDADKADKRIGFSRKEMYSKDIYASIKPYDKHIFFGVGAGTGTVWPEKFESRGVGRLLNDLREETIKAHSKATGAKVKEPKFKLSLSDDTVSRVLVFPEQVAYAIDDFTPLVEGGKPNNFEAQWSLLMRAHLLNDKSALETIAKGTVVKQESIKNLPHFFVCVHLSRDKRCGYTGPRLMASIKTELAGRGRSEAPVIGISHIGGHKFAGNVIVMSPRSKHITPSSSKDSSQSDAKDSSIMGDWYGYVTPKDVPAIVESAFTHTVIPRIWRGAMGVDLEYIDPDKDKDKDVAAPAAESAEAAACDNCDCDDASKKKT